MEIIAPELSMQWLRRGARSVLVPNLYALFRQVVDPKTKAHLAG